MKHMSSQTDTAICTLAYHFDRIESRPSAGTSHRCDLNGSRNVSSTHLNRIISDSVNSSVSAAGKRTGASVDGANRSATAPERSGETRFKPTVEPEMGVTATNSSIPRRVTGQVSIVRRPYDKGFDASLLSADLGGLAPGARCRPACGQP
jgi:hypothetical protein